MISLRAIAMLNSLDEALVGRPELGTIGPDPPWLICTTTVRHEVGGVLYVALDDPRRRNPRHPLLAYRGCPP